MESVIMFEGPKAQANQGEQQQKSGTGRRGIPTLEQAADPSEDWSSYSGSADRRRLQNRLAQRTYRKNLRERQKDRMQRNTSMSSSQTRPALQGRAFSYDASAISRPQQSWRGTPTVSAPFQSPHINSINDWQFHNTMILNMGSSTTGPSTRASYPTPNLKFPAPSGPILDNFFDTSPLTHQINYSMEDLALDGFAICPSSSANWPSPESESGSGEEVEVEVEMEMEMEMDLHGNAAGEPSWTSPTPTRSNPKQSPLVLSRGEQNHAQVPTPESTDTGQTPDERPSSRSRSLREQKAKTGAPASPVVSVPTRRNQTTQHLPSPHPPKETQPQSTGWSPLHKAALHGHTSIARLLLDSGASPNLKTSCGRIALQIALEHSHTSMVELLLMHKACTAEKDARGRTMLHHAAERGDTLLAGLLLQQGGSVDVVDNLGRTPLLLAAGRGMVEVVKMLLGAGARVDCVDRSGESPLHWAVDGGWEDVVKVLIEHGVMVDARTGNGSEGVGE